MKFSWLEFNTNGHYLAMQQELLNLYLLTGLNFATFFSDNEDIDLPGDDSTDTVYLGMNIGTGVEFTLGSVPAVVEGKYVLSSAHQLVMSAGLRILL